MRHVEPAMNLIQKGETQLLDAASTGGQIRIGASDTICRYFLIPYLEGCTKHFRRAYQSNQPNVHEMCRASAKRTCRSYCCKLSEQSPRNNNFRYAHQKFRDVFIAGIFQN